MPKKLPIFFLIFTLAGACATVVMRVSLVRNDTDLSTGFYMGAYSQPVWILNILTAVWIVALLTPLFFLKRADAQMPSGRHLPLGAWSGLGALVLFVAGIGAFGTLVTSSPSGGLFLDALFTLAAGGYFAVQCKGFLSEGYQARAGLALLPTIWAVVHLVTSWMHFTTITNIPNDLFDLLKMIAFMLFFYYHARLMGSVPNGRESKGVFAFGLLSVFLGLLYALPPLLVWAFGAKTASFSVTDCIATVVLCIYILVLFARFFLSAPAEETVEILPAA